MLEHAHGCLNCRPDMVPDFDPDDSRYHAPAKCGVHRSVLVNGVALGYTQGHFEGREGWALLVAEDFDISKMHDCPNCTTRTADGFLDTWVLCVAPRFGVVTTDKHADTV